MHGGEIFVPKIPSMHVVDLARALAPRCDVHEVGIRPGEKLHEVLVPVEEARQTIEFERHYTIQPAFSWWDPEARQVDNGEQGAAVPDGFAYTSDTNERWLGPDELLAALGGSGR
jgi:UDP-N-acetylglucosamine 4,6-dehydratase